MCSRNHDNYPLLGAFSLTLSLADEVAKGFSMMMHLLTTEMWNEYEYELIRLAKHLMLLAPFDHMYDKTASTSSCSVKL